MAQDQTQTVSLPAPPAPGRVKHYGRLGLSIGLSVALLAVLRAWHWFGAFRRTRPFWGGLWLILGGWTIMSLALAPIALVVAAGAGGLAGYLVGGGMIVFGLTAWLAPSQRHVAGLFGTVFAVASLVASNLGGFLVGMLLGVIGGSMIMGWGPKRARRDSGQVAR